MAEVLLLQLSTGWRSLEAAVQPVAAALASAFCSGLQTMASFLFVDSSITLNIVTPSFCKDIFTNSTPRLRLYFFFAAVDNLFDLAPC